MNISESSKYFPSDKRIKHDICPVSGLLSKLNDLEFVSYCSIDHNYGAGLCEVGVIAQNVAEIFPSMVITRNGVIPNIYKDVDYSIISDGIIRISIKNNLKDNARVLLIAKSEDSSSYKHYMNITNVTSESFDVEKWPTYSVPYTIFVHGEMIEDFHAVDGEQIGILGAACVKELHHYVKCQSEKIAELEANNALFQQQIANILSRLP
jgi:hypothetical protein